MPTQRIPVHIKFDIIGLQADVGRGGVKQAAIFCLTSPNPMSATVTP